MDEHLVKTIQILRVLQADPELVAELDSQEQAMVAARFEALMVKAHQEDATPNPAALAQVVWGLVLETPGLRGQLFSEADIARAERQRTFMVAVQETDDDEDEHRQAHWAALVNEVSEAGRAILAVLRDPSREDDADDHRN